MPTKIPMDEKRETLALFYKTLLTVTGRAVEYNTYEQITNIAPESLIDTEYDSVVAGKVTKISQPICEDLTAFTVSELIPVWSGVSSEYLDGYYGKVPQNDLKFAHSLVQDFFAYLTK